MYTYVYIYIYIYLMYIYIYIILYLSLSIYIYIYMSLSIYIHILHIYIYIHNLHLGLINASPLICVLPQNGLCHYSFTIKQTRNILNVDQILFTIHLLSKGPGRGAWDFINGGGLLIRGGDYIYIYIYMYIHIYIYIYIYSISSPRVPEKHRCGRDNKKQFCSRYCLILSASSACQVPICAVAA